jgi:tRNA/tmRNA/rRNA uracil-C5-methylase (TrmA/RlmC/RlmD family)
MSPISKIIGRASELSDTGQGLVRIGKELYAVSNLLPKEEALLEINSDFQYQKARVLKILKPSAHGLQIADRVQERLCP